MFGWIKRLWSWVSGPTFEDDVERVREATVTCCGFLPTVATVAAILSAKNPVVVGVMAVAAAICEVVSKPAVATLLGTEPPVVNGVAVEGDWVK